VVLVIGLPVVGSSEVESSLSLSPVVSSTPVVGLAESEIPPEATVGSTSPVDEVGSDGSSVVTPEAGSGGPKVKLSAPSTP
jgi:hypothetical protein